MRRSAWRQCITRAVDSSDPRLLRTRSRFSLQLCLIRSPTKYRSYPRQRSSKRTLASDRIGCDRPTTDQRCCAANSCRLQHEFGYRKPAIGGREVCHTRLRCFCSRPRGRADAMLATQLRDRHPRVDPLDVSDDLRGAESALAHVRPRLSERTIPTVTWYDWRGRSSLANPTRADTTITAHPAALARSVRAASFHYAKGLHRVRSLTNDANQISYVSPRG